MYGRGASNNTTNNSRNTRSKNYTTLIDFAKFLRQNGDKLFEKDAKLCLKTDQLLILQEYFQQLLPNLETNVASGTDDSAKGGGGGGGKRRASTMANSSTNKEFLLLYKSNQLHIIQDFMFKITNLKITSEVSLNWTNVFLNLNIFGSLIYLEIKNIPIGNLNDLQTLRNQLETLICVKSLNRVQDLLHLCGADQSSPNSWPRLHTLVLSHNQLTSLDNSFRLAPIVEILDLSHNSIKSCGQFLQNLPKLKKLNLSFNKLESMPDVSHSANTSQLEHLDLSYNNIETIETEYISKLTLLKHLNLQYNIISTIQQLNRLRILSSITEIKFEGNPANLNPNAPLILREILTVVQIKNNLKKTSVNQSPGVLTSQAISRVKRSSSSLNIAGVPRLVVSAAGQDSAAASLDQTPFSMPNQSYMKTNRKSIRSGRLRPNNILIEQETEEALIQVDDTDESNDERRRSKEASMGNPSSSFDSRQLQNEIENIKKMRQNYGTDWLLSSSSLLEKAPQPKKAAQPGQSLISSSFEPSSMPMTGQRGLIEEADEEALEARIGHVIESFAVYRSIEFSVLDLVSTASSKSDETDETRTTCIFSISERCLVEKDETNSTVLCLNEIANLSDIQLSVDSKNRHKVTIKFKENVFARIYEFEDNNEFNSFVSCMKKTLLSKPNLSTCHLYYCDKCKEFARKSTTNTEDDLDRLSGDEILTEKSGLADFSCLKCGRQLMHDGKIVELGDENSSNKNSNTGGGLTLKEVLNSLKPPTISSSAIQTTTLQLPNAEHNTSMLSSSSNKNSDTNSIVGSEMEDESTNHESTSVLTSNKNEKLQALLANTQLSRSKLDEITAESKRINNNLKLYFIINVLTETTSRVGSSGGGGGGEDGDEDNEERLMRSFRVKYLTSWVPPVETTSSSRISSSNSGGMANLENCLCMFTNKNVFIFKIVNQEMFEKNIEFDKCLSKCHVIPISQIEIVELSLVQNYLVLEVANLNSSVQQNRTFYKLVTCDIYQTQSMLNSLSKIINESKTLTMLKKIRKKNETTNKNLENVLVTFENSLRLDLDLTAFDLYTFIDEFKLNGKDEVKKVKFEKRAFELILFNNESLIVVEENLNYFQLEGSVAKSEQFNMIEWAKIGDIVHLQLFDDNETRIEIRFVDEARNSKEISWTFTMNKPYLLSKLILHIKSVWEKIFFVELPVNF